MTSRKTPHPTLPQWHPFCNVRVGKLISYASLKPGQLFLRGHVCVDLSLKPMTVERCANDRIPTCAKKLCYKVSDQECREFAHPDLPIRTYKAKNALTPTIEHKGSESYEVYYVLACEIVSVRPPSQPPEAISLIERCMEGSCSDEDLPNLIRTYALTPEQEQWLSQNGVTLSDVFLRVYPAALGGQIRHYLRVWEDTLEYPLFY